MEKHLCKAIRLSADVVQFTCDFPGCGYVATINFKTREIKTNAREDDPAHSGKEIRVVIEPQSQN